MSDLTNTSQSSSAAGNGGKKEAPLGILACTALVVGTMIGSGVFLLPATLGSFGPIALFGWVATSIGAIFLALAFARLSRMIPNKTGGPFVYSRAAFGDFPGFIIAYGYWIALLTGCAGISVAFTSYLSFFFPIVGESSTVALVVALGAIWGLTFVNMRGVEGAGMVQIITTILKLVPLLGVGLLGLFWIDSSNYEVLNHSNESNFSAIATCAAITLWAYIGLEAATVPSGDVQDPERTIPIATTVGTIIAATVYIAVTAVTIGVIPADQLIVSNAPVAEAASLMWGPVGGFIVALGAIVSTFGALNGLILLTSQVPYGAAQEKCAPSPLGKASKNGTPVNSLLLTASLASLMVIINLGAGLVGAFGLIASLAVVSGLLPYAICAVCEFALRLKGGKGARDPQLRTAAIIGALGFGYSIWAISGVDAETVYLGFLLLLAAVPIYLFVQWRNAVHRAAETGSDD